MGHRGPAGGRIVRTNHGGTAMPFGGARFGGYEMLVGTRRVTSGTTGGVLVSDSGGGESFEAVPKENDLHSSQNAAIIAKLLELSTVQQHWMG